MARSRSPLVSTVARAALLVSLLGATSCATIGELVVATALEKVVEDEHRNRSPADVLNRLRDRERPPRSSGSRVASIYIAGAVPGWQRGLLPTPSVSSAYFEGRLSGGRCPAINISSPALRDPFGRIEEPPPERFGVENGLNIDSDYIPFGQVALGGPGPVAYPWEPLAMYGMAGGGCTFPGIPLLTFGKSHTAVAHR